jgi:uncharacterized protein involved in exopolysaccharide biosynthesis
MFEELTTISIIIALNFFLGIILLLVPFWSICKRTGLPPALSILSLIPVANVIFLFYLAFAQWPAMNSENNLFSQERTGNKALTAAGIFLLILTPLIVSLGIGYTLTVPKMYTSQARIQIHHDDVDMDPFSTTASGQAYDPNFLRTQFEIIQSQPVLIEVIHRLNLQQVWGKDGNPMPEARACEILRSSIRISPSRDTSLVVLQATRPNPKEAMRIANTLTEVYLAKRLEQKNQEINRGQDALRQELIKQQDIVNAAAQKTEALRKELDVTVDPNQIKPANLQQTERDLALQKSLLDQMKTQFAKEALTQKLPRKPVDIIEAAEASARPVSSNLRLNILLSVGLAGFFALIGLILLIAGRKRRTV